MTMTHPMRKVTGTSGGAEAGHLLLTEGDVQLMAANPEQVAKEIQRRAEQVSSVLEGILLESQGTSRWGINE